MVGENLWIRENIHCNHGNFNAYNHIFRLLVKSKQSYGNLGKGDESDRPEVEDIVIDNESDIYNIGDEIQVKNVDYGTNREYVAKSYIVNSVKYMILRLKLMVCRINL